MEMDKTDKARALYQGEALAPMVRASTTPLRTLAIQYGADFVYTEELVDRAILETKRVVVVVAENENENGGIVDYVKDTSKMSQRVQRRMQRDSLPPLLLRIDRAVEQNKLVLQLGTGEPEFALQAALHVHRDVDAIDVNMGCPKPFSVSGGMGSALLSDPDRACRIIKTLSNNLPDNKPVSAKIRLLPGGRGNASQTVDFITALIHAGANAVAIHGRHVGDESQTPADWETLENVVALSKSKFPLVPILVNGDFYTRREFTDFMAQSGADGVLLARPALYNTSIFRKGAAAALDGVNGDDNAPSAIIQKDYYSYDSSLLLDKTTVIQDYLRHVQKYNMHHKNAKYVICEMMNNRRAPLSRVPFLKQVYPGKQTIGLMSSCTSVADICRLWNLSENIDNNIITAQNGVASSARAATINNSSSAPIVVPTNGKEPTAILTAGEHRYDDSYLLKMAEAPIGGVATAAVTTAAAASTTAPSANATATSSKEDVNINILLVDSQPPPTKKIRVDGDK
jgi:tRNA-dihydrouridine synthase 2